jgi:hypothetical protein
MIQRAGDDPALRRRSFFDDPAAGKAVHPGEHRRNGSRVQLHRLRTPSTEAPWGKRGPRSGKRESVAAAMRNDVSEKSLTVASLKAMPEKELAHRYRVSRDTARKARFEALE